MMANPAGKGAQQAERAKFWAQFQETWQQVGAIAATGTAQTLPWQALPGFSTHQHAQGRDPRACAG